MAWLLLAAVAAACSSTADSNGGGAGTPASTEAVTSVVTETLPATAPPGESNDAPVVTAVAADADNGPPPPTATESTAPPVAPGGCADDLAVRERIALLVWPAVSADNWAAAVDTVRSNDVGGVLLMSQAGLDADDVRARLSELEAASRHGLIVATDEEGGDVQRLRSLGELPSQRQVSQDYSPDGAADLIADHGAILRAVGIDMILGPVVDVEPNVGEVPLQPSRFFDGGPDLVADYASAYVRGWERAGLLATLKHYPGHGAASGDTHITAGVTPSLDDLRDFDLKPYRDLAAQATAADAAVMVGHLTVPGLTDGVPATRSPAAVDYLRTELGYGNALLITDALGMAAVGIPEPEAAVLALAAGIDVVLFTLTSQTDEVIDALEQAVADGRIDAEHVDRAARKVMALLGRDGHTCNANR
jgi:beta-N-acetylhexosaminidase